MSFCHTAQWSNFLVRVTCWKNESGNESGTTENESLPLEYTFTREVPASNVKVGDSVRPQASKCCTMTLPIQLISDINPNFFGVTLEQLG